MTNVRHKSGHHAVAMAILTAAALSGCMGEAPSEAAVADWGDENYYPEAGGAYASLTALVGTCTFNSASGVMAVTGTAGTAQTIIVSRRPVDSAILINGATCGATPATATSLKILNVVSTTGDQVVILDFLNGLFGLGTATVRGINVTLGTGTDALRIRGSAAIDTMTFAAAGISTDTGANRDIDFVADIESFSVSLAGGADVFVGTGFAMLVTVFGGDGNDNLTGTAQADVLNGGDGDDTFTGGLGADVMNGDAGNDTFLETAVTSGADTFNGGAGTADHVSYALRTAAITVTIDAVADDGLTGEADTVAVDIEIVTGGTAADSLTGGAGAETLNGGLEDDTLAGGLGADILNGDGGDDTFDEGSVTSGGDIFNGGVGTDTVDYSARVAVLTVTMDGVAGLDGLTGELDNVKADVENIIGGSANDNITGNVSANVIDGGLGDDTLSGGDGNDTFLQGASDDGSDTLNGGLGSDLVNYSGRSAALTVTMDGVAGNDGEAGEADNVKVDVEDIVGGSAINTITGNLSANSITGGAADDVLSGGAGDDTIDGAGGDNTLTCGTGDDIAFNEGAMGSRASDCEL